MGKVAMVLVKPSLRLAVLLPLTLYPLPDSLPLTVAIPIVPLAIIGALSLVLAILVVAVSRHKKSSTEGIRLIGATGFVETMLDPTGTVLVGGELWRARSRSGTVMRPANKIAVVGLENHFLVVEVVATN